MSEITGFTILQQLEYGDKHVPACGIYVSGTTTKVPMIMVELYLTREANDNDLDQLRVALKSWAKKCDFGELRETGVEWSKSALEAELALQIRSVGVVGGLLTVCGGIRNEQKRPVIFSPSD